jgi:hypothetical protein
MSVRRVIGLALAALAVASLPAEATMLKQMNLADLSKGADRIFRGTVTGIDTSTVRAGGGTLPVVIYRIKVSDALKGQFVTKGGRTYAEVRMLGDLKTVRNASGAYEHVSVLRDLPRLRMGSEYLLFTTPPSRAGLSTTLGLGQGLFKIPGHVGREDGPGPDPVQNARREDPDLGAIRRNQE